MHLLNTARLERHAHDLAVAATRLAALQTSLRSGAGALHWRSPAARAFATALQSALGQLGASAGRLHDLAGSVRQHSARAGTHARELQSAATRGEADELGIAAVDLGGSAAVHLGSSAMAAAAHLRPR